jgi:hypothetical protein
MANSISVLVGDKEIILSGTPWMVTVLPKSSVIVIDCVSAPAGREEKAIALAKTIVSAAIVIILFFFPLLSSFFDSLMVVSLFLSFHLNVFIWVTIVTRIDKIIYGIPAIYFGTPSFMTIE